MANKSTTIKGATDKELDDLLYRLREERELQSLIREIKRCSLPNGFRYDDDVPISTEEPIESMYHFGIPGMRWGRRKTSTSDTSTGAKKTPVDSEDHLKKLELKAKHLRTMSNADLKELTTRLQLEKQYKELTKKEMSPGKKFILDTLADVGKEAAKTYTKKYATQGIDALLKSVSKKAAS